MPRGRSCCPRWFHRRSARHPRHRPAPPAGAARRTTEPLVAARPRGGAGGPAAVAEGVLRRLRRTDRGRGDRQRGSAVQAAPGPPGQTNRTAARRDPGRDAAGRGHAGRPVLALAANTSFGGLPVLASLLARNAAGRGGRQHPDADPAVRHRRLHRLHLVAGRPGRALRRTRPPRWRYRASLNGLGAAVTAVATVVFLATKFTDSAWAVVLALPAFIMLFTRIHRYYDQAGRALGIGGIPGKPHARPAAVVVPVTGVSRLAQCGISAALSISEHVEAVTVARSGAAEESERVRELQRQWTRWNPGVPQAALPVPCTTTSTWSSPGSCGTGRTSSSPASRCGCSSTAVPRR
jgi:hypothetical protein